MNLLTHPPALLVSIALALLAPCQTAAEPIKLDAIQIPLDTVQSETSIVGLLRYRGGLHLSSDHSSFGGLSALGSNADGSSLLGVTDRGFRVELFPQYDGEGNLTGITRAAMAPLMGENGDVLMSKFESDAESLSPGANGEIIVAFERQHRLLMYHPGELVPVQIPPPYEISDAPLNGGIEALTLLADGRLLAIAQSLGAGDQRVGWISDRAGWSPLIYIASDGFDPTGAATLPDGDVLVLERRYGLRDGSRVRIRRIPERALAPGTTLEGSLVAELTSPLSVDNMEGIAVRPSDPTSPMGGNAIVYIISDDNFDRLEQRTLLMMFELQ